MLLYTKVIEKKTGKEFHAQYVPNKRGNMQYWIDGIFYADKKFDAKFKILEAIYI